MDLLISILLIPFAMPLALGFVTMCCCPSICTVHVNDDFNRASLGADWDVRSGTITMPGTVARTTSVNALVVHASASSNLVHAAVRVSLDTDGDQAKIVVAYQDDNNYLYALFTRTSTTVTTQQLYKRVTGVETQLGSTDTTTIAMVGQQWIQASYDGETLCAVISGSDVAVTSGAFSWVVAEVDTAMSGTGMGWGTGTITGTAEFDHARFENQHVDNSLCRHCHTCSVCTPRQVVTEYEVVISGVVSAGACSATCPDLNSTFILTSGGGSSCSWCYNALTICGRTNGFSLGFSGALVTMSVLESDSPTACGGIVNRGFKADLGAGASCTVNGQSLSPFGASLYGCDHSAAACTVSAV